MATTYHASQQVQCWKMHQCIDCGCGFRYRFERLVKAAANTEAKAQAALKAKVITTIQEEVDVHPCPWCGRIQPDMVGQIKAVRHFWIGAIALLLGFVILILGWTRVLWFNQTSIAMAMLLAVSAVLYWLVARQNPNRDLAGNYDKADASLKQRKIEIVQKGGDPDDCDPAPLLGTGHRLAIGLAIAAAVFALSPMMFQVVNQLPFNAGTVPDVVSAGDGFTIHFPQNIDCVDSRWRGVPHATVLNQEAVGNVAIRTTAHQSDWGGTINAKSSQMHTSVRPSAELRIAPNAQVAGKTVVIRTQMSIEFPFSNAPRSFVIQKSEMSTDTPVTLAGPGMQALYMTIWFLALIGAPVVSFVAAWWLWKLDKRLQATAIPSVVQPLADPSGRSDGSKTRPAAGPEVPKVDRDAIRKPRRT